LPADLVCFSHLRWHFVYQRPNHLMARAARDRRVFFVEEPTIADGRPRLELVATPEGVTVVSPRIPDGLSSEGRRRTLASLIDELLTREAVIRPWLWYYTPMALPWTSGIEAGAVVYDCMDELAAFRGAPEHLKELEAELLGRADVVFTGGRSLWEAKVARHPRVEAFPSAVDVAHFRRARVALPQPQDQAAIPRPRVGYYGVIDERIDLGLLDAVAAARPAWQLVLVGPLAKVSPDDLPTRPNVHRLGLKGYAELPAYLGGWDVAMMPFAINESTRYISPTKTPEYLGGAKPVVSTPIRDVVEPYGRLGLVAIADTTERFVAAIERALEATPDERAALTRRADMLLGSISWDRTWAAMQASVLDAVRSAPEAPRFAARRRRADAIAASS
jgi:UDP-galactopyranose mutase